MPRRTTDPLRPFRHAALLAAITVAAACGEGGDSDDAEMPKDPSTTPAGARTSDSSTQVAPTSTATSTATGTATDTAATRPRP